MPPANLSRSITTRLDSIKKQYQRDLVPLKEQREALAREIAELKAVRDVFLEETTALNARNEELAQLSAQYSRRMVPIPETPSKNPESALYRHHHAQQSTSHLNTLSPSTTGYSTTSDETMDSKFLGARRMAETELPTPSKGKFIKWPGSKPKEAASPMAPSLSASESRGKGHLEHNFQQLSVLRFTRCDHCTEKMWGSQLRCMSTFFPVAVRA